MGRVVVISTGALELVAHSADCSGFTGAPSAPVRGAALAVIAAPDSANRLISAGRNFSSMIFRKRNREHMIVMCRLTQGRRRQNKGAMAPRQQRDAGLTHEALACRISPAADRAGLRTAGA